MNIRLGWGGSNRFNGSEVDTRLGVGIIDPVI